MRRRIGLFCLHVNVSSRAAAKQSKNYLLQETRHHFLPRCICTVHVTVSLPSSATSSQTQCCRLTQNRRYRVHQWNKGPPACHAKRREEKRLEAKRPMPNQGACKTQGSGPDEIWVLGLALRTSFLTHYAPLLRNASRLLVAIWGQPVSFHVRSQYLEVQ